jgi:hypothetical protein
MHQAKYIETKLQIFKLEMSKDVSLYWKWKGRHQKGTIPKCCR